MMIYLALVMNAVISVIFRVTTVEEYLMLLNVLRFKERNAKVMSRELHYTEDEYGYCQELCPYSHIPFEGVSGIGDTRIGSAACSGCKFNEYAQH